MKLQKISFNNAEIETAIIDGKPFVALRPICDALGLDWSNQRDAITKDPVLDSVVVISTTTGTDGKQYEMLCLPLDYLNGWLFKINANRYKGERRELIIKYQRECYRVLAEHFLGNRASGPVASAPAACAFAVPLDAAAFDAFQNAVNRKAADETVSLIGELRNWTRQRGIFSDEELISIASQLNTEITNPFSWPSVYVHPATAARCVDRICRTLSK